MTGPFVIRTLKKYKISQQIRADGPATHLKKSGTPTMGGIIILMSLLVATILWARLDNRFILLMLLSTVWLGLLGFLDDYLKLVKNHPVGLPAIYKLIGQTVLAFFIGIYLYHFPPNPQYATMINIPYLKNCFLNLGCFYLLFTVVFIVGTSNAVNLTDGLDGLAVGSIIIAALSYALMAYISGHARFSSYLLVVPVKGAGELTVFLGSMVGAGLGFLWFNTHPADVFMGDTGSLFLGGSIGIVAVFIKQEILFLVIGGVFIIETLSVIIQVGVFKLKARRIFRMAPLHHHFELMGWHEEKVVTRFWILSIIMALLALSSLKIR